jgi:hypothetical protein
MMCDSYEDGQDSSLMGYIVSAWIAAIGNRLDVPAKPKPRWPAFSRRLFHVASQ